MNPGLTAAEFLKIFNRFEFPLRLIDEFRETLRRYTENRFRAVIFGNLQQSNGAVFFANLKFTAFPFLLLIETEWIYLRVTDASPNLFKFYRNTGGDASDLMFSVASADDGDTGLALVAETAGTGITGTIDIGTIAASALSDTIKIRLVPDYSKILEALFDGTETSDIGTDGLRDRGRQLLNTLANAHRGMINASRSFFQLIMTAYVMEKIKASNRSAPGISISLPQDATTGAMAPVITGELDQLRRAMLENNSGGALIQSVLNRVPTVSAAAFSSSNRGVGSLSAVQVYPGMLLGRFNFYCTSGFVPSNGKEKFRVTFTPSGPQGLLLLEDTIDLAKSLFVGGLFADPVTGIKSCTLSRVPTVTTFNTQFATAGMVFTGERPSNTDVGKVYLRRTANSPNTIIKVYKSSQGATDEDTEELIAQDTTGRATGATFVASGIGRYTAFSLTGVIGANATTTTDVTIVDCEPFYSDSTESQEADSFYFDTVAPAAGSDGLIQELITLMFPGGRFHETTAPVDFEDFKIKRGSFIRLLERAE